ncbi:type VII secretion target [uncultured Mycolicibacterium sp.]|uniref:type VII secretion target n=1 Tax=uncultured Mycolicibacterium sp. TaxID=2320817 RepID=UPI0026368550|nr:type VII secretion target [uncultured Mycolicibacterium sp.]
MDPDTARRDTARVDTAALMDIARRYDDAAHRLDALARGRLAGLRFGAARAGRDHAQHGTAVAAALWELTDGVRRWSRACAELAAALRTTALRYADAEAVAAQRF